MRRNVKIVLFPAVGIAVLVALSLLVPGIHSLLARIFAAAPHDSPIEVAGGSIHVLDKDAAGITRCGFLWRYYCAYTDDATVIYLNGATTPMLAPNGWVISVSNTNESSSEIADAVTLCTDSQCSLANPHGGKIYIKIRKGAKWIKYSSKEFHFHDAKNCPGTSEVPACDHLVTITVTKTGSSPKPIPCEEGGVNGKCTIGIGTPPPPPPSQFR